MCLEQRILILSVDVHVGPSLRVRIHLVHDLTLEFHVGVSLFSGYLLLFSRNVLPFAVSTFSL
jgi:hypothetical protein